MRNVPNRINNVKISYVSIASPPFLFQSQEDATLSWGAFLAFIISHVKIPIKDN